VDELIVGLWTLAVAETPLLGHGIAVLAVGGYGRRELFPYSDVDLLYLLDGKVSEAEIKQPVRRISQQLWDCGIRLAPATRRRSEAERFDEENAEFTIALLDHRLLAGDAEVYRRLAEVGFPKMLERENKALAAGLVQLTSERHAKYGDTPFHLEPSIKDCPGGLRDVHVCAWLRRLEEVGRGAKTAEAGGASGGLASDREEFRQAVEFLFTVRCFLHYRHERDDNTLDWHAQDAAAAMGIGMGARRLEQLAEPGAEGVEAAYWMRSYFRHARSVERCLTQMLDGAAGNKPRKVRWTVSAKAAFSRGRRGAEAATVGFRVTGGRLALDGVSDAAGDPAVDPDVVLQLFAAMARTGSGLERGSEQRISQGLPLLSAHLEEGPSLWRHMQEILEGFYAGKALRMMHTLGILELLIPEFHGIDALVIRDAYHRYTVDEHTLVVIDTLHGLEQPQTGQMSVWAGRFGGILRDVQHPALLFLAALLHDTGKGRSSDNHALESARMAENVAGRLALDAYESELMLGLIRNHLEMSCRAAKRYFRSGDSARVRGQGADAGGAAHVDAVYLRGHPGGASRRADAVEGGEFVEAVLGDGELSGPQRGRRAGGGADRQGAGGPRGGAAAGQAGRGGGVPGGVPGALSAHTHAGAGAAALRHGGTICRGPGADRVPPRGGEQRDHPAGARPPAAVCRYGGGAGGVGDEHRYRGRLLQPAGHCGGQLPLHRHLSHAGDECVGARHVCGQRSRRDGGQAGGGEAAWRAAARDAESCPRWWWRRAWTTTTRCRRTARCCRWWRRTFPGCCVRSAWRWRSADAISTWHWWTPRARRRSTSSTSRAMGRSWMRPSRRS
jgi:hypothetical protein